MMNKQTILVAGATGNIGGGAAVALAKRGARVVLLGHQDTDVATLVIDFSDTEAVNRAAAEALNRFPMINGLVLSVGVLLQNGPHILPSGHEVMFATNVIGPFIFTRLLAERMQQSDGLVLHVINPTYREIDWDDLESIQNHKTGIAMERTKTLNQVFAAELARRYAGKISSIAFLPTYIIDKNDPELAERWPSGFMGFFWKVLTVLIAKPPAVAGEPIADLMVSHDRYESNGALYRLDKRVEKPLRAMSDEELGKRFWDELVQLTGPMAESPVRGI